VPPVDPGELADLIAPHVTDGAPGHAAGVYRGGVLVAHAAAGCAVIEHDVPIGAGTVFDIASASKQFTAACLLLLQRDGMLSLDEDVHRYLPELLLPVPVTLRQCLSHTSGLREYYSLCELAGVPEAGMDEARLMGLLAGQTSLNFPPGTGWSYSNSGFVLAAAALRRVSGRSLAEFAADRVFGPLGMRATRFRDDLALPVPGLATGYTPAPGGGWHRADITEETVGDGGSSPRSAISPDGSASCLPAQHSAPTSAMGCSSPPCSPTVGGCPTRSAWRSPRSAAVASTCIRATSTGSGRRWPT
jgi:CubicO group peptidase (beta-lactamase class C family)